MEANRSGQKRLSELSNLMDLSHRFREEMRSARSIDRLNSGANRLTLNREGGEVVEFESEGQRVTAIRRKGKEVVNRESYRLVASMSAKFEVVSEPQAIGTLVLIQSPIGVGGGRTKITRIDGVLGANFRFEEGAGP
jgi:hypothetical protein